MTKREARYQKLQEMGGIHAIAEKLGTSIEPPAYGISSREADFDYEERRRAFGTNTYPRADPANFFSMFAEALQDTTLIILVISAIVSLVLGIVFPPEGEESTGWIEGTAILLAVLACSVVTAGNDWNKERQFRALSASSDLVFYEVWRNGRLERLSIADLLVGDVVALSQGDKVPADGLFIDGRGGTECSTDESVMTGETVAICIDEQNPVMLSGTLVQEGLAHMLVLATGSRSQWGELLANLGDDKPETPLQQFLDQLAVMIGYVGLSVAGAVFCLMLLYWAIELLFWPVYRCVPLALPGSDGARVLCFDAGVPLDHGFELAQLSRLVDFFIIAVTIVVVAVPEGLPLAVTISLAYSMRKMMADNNLVRHLDACETMGGCTTICSDKTGTLTENRMTVVRGLLSTLPFTLASLSSLPPLSPALLDLLCDGIAINSKARFEPPAPVDAALGRRPQFFGSKTECALLLFAHTLRAARNEPYPYAQLRERVPTAKLYHFTSTRKRMSTIVALDGGQGGFRLFCKGAAEVVVERCARVMGEDGAVRELGEEERAQVEAAVGEMATEGLRTLALAFRDFGEARDWEREEESREDGTPEHGLVLIGVVGIEDPVRAEVPNAVQQCQSAGIIVRMVTGDNVKTAIKIAHDCGILDPSPTPSSPSSASSGAVQGAVSLGSAGHLAMEGERFRRLSESELDEVLPRLRVLARSSPLDKKRLVDALMARREVVAVTGDGTNDAPALKKAHVGLSMGIAGTEVAKEASDIVLLDDNFRSIVAAVMWGRCVYDNIRKFLQFQLTVNMVALVVAAVGAATNKGTPLTAIQLLWVNLIMDTLAALALSLARPLPDLLKRRPYGLKDRFISNIMLRNVLGQGLYQIGVLCTLLYVAPLIDGVFAQPNEKGGDHYTMLFNTFVWMQIFNEFNSRCVNNEANILRDILHNYSFLAVAVVTMVFQLVIIEVGIASTFLASAFSTRPLLLAPLTGGSTVRGPLLWLLSVGLGFLSLPLYQLLRLIPVPAQAQGKNDAVELEDDDDPEGNLLRGGGDQFGEEKFVQEVYESPAAGNEE